jgi:hypothetical protein
MASGVRQGFENLPWGLGWAVENLVIALVVLASGCDGDLAACPESQQVVIVVEDNFLEDIGVEFGRGTRPDGEHVRIYPGMGGTVYAEHDEPLDDIAFGSDSEPASEDPNRVALCIYLGGRECRTCDPEMLALLMRGRWGMATQTQKTEEKSVGTDPARFPVHRTTTRAAIPSARTRG